MTSARECYSKAVRCAQQASQEPDEIEQTLLLAEARYWSRRAADFKQCERERLGPRLAKDSTGNGAPS